MASSYVDEVGTGVWSDIPFGGKIEDKEWLVREDHPLLNDLILKRVFAHVRRFDLKACRGVCKKWNEHTLPHMRSIYQVRIHGNNYEEQKTTSHRIADFVRLFKFNELGIPFDKFRLGTFCTTVGVGKQFLKICGEFIKEIVIFLPDCVRRIENISEILQSSPNLEVLRLRGQFISRSRNPVELFPRSKPLLSALKKLAINFESIESPLKYCPTFFDELLSVAQNISHIVVDDIDYEWNPEGVISLVLSSIEKLEKESSIQSLSLESPSVEHVEILKRMAEKPNGLKLKEISLDFNSRYYSEEDIDSTIGIQLATIFKDTLEDFNENSGTFGVNLMEFPRMPKLKSCKFCVLSDSVHEPVDLNQILPVIETLDLKFDYGTCKVNPFKFFSQFHVCPNLRTLFVENIVLSIRIFREILRVFPNLKKIALFLFGEETGQILTQIWANMTQLESLSLSFYDGSKAAMKLDSLLTGIPNQGLNQIRHVIPDLEKMTVQERREKILDLVEEHMNQKPSIRNLTNLRHLKLYVIPKWTSIGLSDITGYLAIYLMKHLVHLDIQSCDLAKTCCEILTRETGLEAWRFETGRMESQYIPSFQTSILN